jgi:nitroreductase
MELLEGIYSRRSVRQYSAEPVTMEEVGEILKAGSWAPSGLNNQPWRFVVVRDPGVKGELARLTKYKHIINGASVTIPVFCDREAMYNDLKDHQGIGACLQNMLLAAHAMGLGAVWLGEILNSADKVNDLLDLPLRYELMAVIAVGHPVGAGERSDRKNLSDLLLKEI